jgi:hypothetical protein
MIKIKLFGLKLLLTVIWLFSLGGIEVSIYAVKSKQELFSINGWGDMLIVEVNL